MQNTVRRIFFGFSLVFVLFFWVPSVAGAETVNQSQAGNNQDTVANGQANVPSTEVEVEANKEESAKEGSAAAGYKVDNTTTTGPWGKMKLQDTPYSINVMSSDLIENLQVSTMDQLFRINPLVQVNYGITRNGSGQINVRGVQGITAMVDGVRAGNNHAGIFLEDVERVEILSGLSGFLYGSQDVGGDINYVLKRPTSKTLNEVTIGNFGGSNYYVHGDFGGPASTDGKIGYRINVLDQNGATAVDGQSIKRQLASGAIDWHIADNVLLQFDAAHSYSYVQGAAAAFRITGSPLTAPTAPDASKLWTPSWSYEKVTTDSRGSNLTWNLNDKLTLRSAYRYWDVTQEGRNVINKISPSGIISNYEVDAWKPYGTTTTGYNTFLDYKFNTGTIEHTLTAGIYGSTLKTRWGGSVWLTAGSNYSQPTDPADFTLPSYTLPTYSPYTNSKTVNTNRVIGDNIKFDGRWSALVGINHSEIETASYSQSGSQTSYYDKSANTPTASLIYKPTDSVTAYASYIEGLEAGSTASTTYNGLPVANAGLVMAPEIHKQYEIGVKQTVGKTLFTAALFRMNLADPIYELNSAGTAYTLIQDGAQVNKGFELTATGKVSDRLTVVGGFTILSAVVTTNNDGWPGTAGAIPDDVSKQMAKVYLEYEMPNIPGLTLTGGAFYYGPFTNSGVQFPGVTTFDFGARYATKVHGMPVTYRLNVSNLFDKNYWTANYFEGAPRTISLSATMNF